MAFHIKFNLACCMYRTQRVDCRGPARVEGTESMISIAYHAAVKQLQRTDPRWFPGGIFTMFVLYVPNTETTVHRYQVPSLDGGVLDWSLSGPARFSLAYPLITSSTMI